MNNQRRFTPQYKEEIIKLVTEQGKIVTHYIGVNEAMVRRWVKKMTNFIGLGAKLILQIIHKFQK